MQNVIIPSRLFRGVMAGIIISKAIGVLAVGAGFSVLSNIPGSINEYRKAATSGQVERIKNVVLAIFEVASLVFAMAIPLFSVGLMLLTKDINVLAEGLQGLEVCVLQAKVLIDQIV
jgi:hypothetical protein